MQMQEALKKLVVDFKANEATNPDLLVLKIWGKTHQRDDGEVNNLMNRLRKSLKGYYESDGVGDPILITAPPAPRGKSRATWIEVSIREPSLPPSPTTPVSRWRLLAPVGCVILCVLVAGLLLPLRITQPVNNGIVGSKPTIVGRGGVPWHVYYLVVEPESGGGRYVQFDEGPLQHGPLLGWEREVNIGNADTQSGTWFYVYAIPTAKELQATVDYVPATGRLLAPATGARPSHAIRVQFVK